MVKEAPIPKHCGVPMTITGFRMWCKGCGYEEKYEPKAWHAKAQQLTAAPKHVV